MNAKEVIWMGKHWWECGVCRSKRTRRAPSEQCCGGTNVANEHNIKNATEGSHGFIAARCADRESDTAHDERARRAEAAVTTLERLAFETERYMSKVLEVTEFHVTAIQEIRRLSGR